MSEAVHLLFRLLTGPSTEEGGQVRLDESDRVAIGIPSNRRIMVGDRVCYANHRSHAPSPRPSPVSTDMSSDGDDALGARPALGHDLVQDVATGRIGLIDIGQ